MHRKLLAHRERNGYTFLEQRSAPAMHRTIRQIAAVGDFAHHAPGMANRIPLPPGYWADFDPFLIMAEDQFGAPGGFPDHPHRGIETVTLVLDGALRHADNRGNSGVLR